MSTSIREPESLDFSLSPLTIPERFHGVRYNGSRYPGAEGVVGLDGGANCQQFAYELIRHFGFAPPNYRSSELWEDETHTSVVVGEWLPCDLLLFNRTPAAWGAHVAVYLGSKLAIHLSQRAGVPVIWRIEDFRLRPEYACFIGVKRVTTLVTEAGAMANASLSARHFTDCAQLVLNHIVARAFDRGMLRGELSGATAGMLAILSMLRWERKVGRAALERLTTDIDALARELDAAIDEEGCETRQSADPRSVVTPSGQRGIAVETEKPVQPLLEQAEHESLALGHTWVGTEHLLLAAIRLGCPRLNDVLKHRSITYEATREAILELLST